MNELWWTRIPAILARYCASFSSVMRDGLYLSAWPVVGALLPPLIFLTGLFVGYERVGYDPLDGVHFLYSFEIVVVFVLVSQLGAALGFWLWLGFALGDFYLYLPSDFTVASSHVIAARFLTYAIAWLALVALPLTQARLTQAVVDYAKVLALAVGGTEAGTRAGLAIITRAVLGYTLAYFWVLSATVLMQAVFIWSGMTPMTHGMVQRWVVQVYTFALIAGYAGGVRSVLVLAAQPAIAERLRAAIPAAPAWSDMAAIPPRALFATFLMGTFLSTWIDAIELFVVFAVVLAGRLFLSRVPGLAGIEKIPLAARMLAAFAIVYVAVHIIISSTAASATTFWPAEVSAVIGMIVFALALPVSMRRAKT